MTGRPASRVRRRAVDVLASTATTTGMTRRAREDDDDYDDDRDDDDDDVDAGTSSRDERTTRAEDEDEDEERNSDGGIVMPGNERRRPTGTREDADEDEDEDDAWDVGRIASALAGHDGTWHLRANRVERGKIKATYAVVFAPGVPVRAQPHVDSAVVRYARKGERVAGTSVTGDGWLELRGDDDEGKNIEGSAGWMLTRHPEHGVLLELASGRELPMTTMRLASAEATEACDHTALPFARHGASYRVSHSPFVPVRESATMRGNIVGHRAEGDVVRANGRRGDWIALEDEDAADEETREKDAKRKRWMLTLHPEFGRLLRRCRDDGSDITL